MVVRRPLKIKYGRGHGDVTKLPTIFISLSRPQRIFEPWQDILRSTRLPEFNIILGLISTRLNWSTIPVPIKTRRLVDYGTKFRRGIDLSSWVKDKYGGFAWSLYRPIQVIEIAKRDIITRYLIIKYWWYEALVRVKAVIIFFFFLVTYVRGYYVKSTKTRNRCFRWN